MARSTKHWHAMNGEHGCLPDNNEVYPNKESAINGLLSLFSDTNTRGMKSALRYTGSFEFPDRRTAGASFCEVVLCHDLDCLQED